LQEDASDIHIEPQEEYVRVRLRKDGLLQESFEPLPSKIKQSVVARLKIMADLDIAERRVPQDGKIRRIFQGRKVDFRVNTLPSRYGEKVVLRILDSTTTQLGLDKLITDQTILEEVRDMTNRPFGLILVTGPTGYSGPTGTRGLTGPTGPTGPGSLPSYTVSELTGPTPAINPNPAGQMVYVSNGLGGRPFAVSTGTAWVYADGTPV
jgi:Tfp pilus assembly pilus retraction ATPase PilT